jgi:hypothetical protein
MQFIEMSGKTLRRVLREDEMPAASLAEIGVTDESVIRVNRQGDIELRRPDTWDVIGGLLGNYEERIKKQTGFEWV